MVNWGYLTLGIIPAKAGPGIPFIGYIGFDDASGTGAGGGEDGNGLPVE